MGLSKLRLVETAHYENTMNNYSTQGKTGQGRKQEQKDRCDMKRAD